MDTNTATVTLRRGDTARTVGIAGYSEDVTIVRAEYLHHSAYIGADGPVPARRERWLHVRLTNGGRLLMHPSNLVKA